MKNKKESFKAVLAELVGTISNGWRWPSPEVGFARYVFEEGGERLPVSETDDLWPHDGRFDQAPVLASSGYVLAGQHRVLKGSWQKDWADGFDRLTERNAFPQDRMSFAFRPLYVLGIALGTATCPLVTDEGRNWMCGVIRQLLKQESTDTWSDLIYGTAAQLLGVQWRDRFFLNLNGDAPEVLALVRWLATTRSATGAGGVADSSLLGAELVRRCSRGVALPTDVARAAVVFCSLSAELSGQYELPAGERKHIKALTGLPVDAPSYPAMPGGASIHYTIVQGDHHVGDNIKIGGDNIGGAVGRSASVVARDINVFKETVGRSTNIDPEAKATLAAARDAVEQATLSDEEKEDVCDNLRKLVAELDKKEKSPGLVRRFWNRINEAAPTVASLAASAASIAAIIKESGNP